MFIPFIRFQYTQRKQLTVQDARIKKKKKGMEEGSPVLKA